MKVGSIVQVKSFSDYMAKVPLEESDGYMPASKVPAGTYVSIKTVQGSVIGIVTGVQHEIKEDVLPFLSEEKQEVFAPYVNDYRSSYLAIHGIGNVQGGKASQSLGYAPVVNDVVELMDNEEIRAFHTPGGRPSFSYYRKLSSALDNETLCCAIDHVAAAVPECKPLLAALKKHTENKA
ncbi:MAG TPA: hypothetical protein VMC84_01425 [Methanocella sp.]|uniref:hypothetical protein n=1 Tax=Methanocella sp. TaxID=2052833 RepID=UPI002C64D512|nr:hypothetical protein [Methanocella sp.]HTY89814.1 hypothetical protein [Methanocella sp.]